jgi:hypothetical protein
MGGQRGVRQEGRKVFETGDRQELDCHRCGSSLLGDPEDEPVDEADGLALCGECVRNREEEADFAMMDLQDGELDGIIEW